jgi:3-deoxy-manno-octulosonate cytidylyltransferase (CMP-KDO synthetase)
VRSIVIIPSRLASTRLSEKPLASIDGKPMVQWVYEQAVAADVGPVVVACCCSRIAQVIESIGGKAILTDPNLPSGTDRVWAAYQALGENYQAIINLQGDLPTMPPAMLSQVLEPLQSQNMGMGTLACPITDEQEIHNPNVVKIALGQINGQGVADGIYFSRSAIPNGAATYYHHIGVYSYTPQVLGQFVQLAPTNLERTERLEQLRVLENGVRIGVKIVDQIPPSVDTLEDLDRVRQHVQGKS